MFKRIFKDTKHPSVSELQQIVDKLSNSTWFKVLIDNSIKYQIDANHIFKQQHIDEMIEISTAIKTKVHKLVNSDAMSELIYEHLKTKISAILTKTQLIDEIVQERVDAAGIEQVIQWNNVAYGMLLSRIEEAEKKFTPYEEIKQRIDDCRNEVYDMRRRCGDQR